MTPSEIAEALLEEERRALRLELEGARLRRLDYWEKLEAEIVLRGVLFPPWEA